MFPRGAIWQRLRTRALDTIPQGVVAPYPRPHTVSAWLRSGAISVAPVSTKRFAISASPNEVGAALLGDSAYHLDHAAEHSAHIRHQLAGDRWFSGAWQTVTFYYWSYYLAVSLTRLTGTTGVFLSSDVASVLATLSGGRISPGPWTIECKPVTTVGHREVELRRPARSRIHELIWYQCFKTLKDCTTETAADQRHGLEDRLYAAIQRSVEALGDTWPSDLRNVANYRPGVAYGAVRRTLGNEAFTGVQCRTAPNFETLLVALEASVVGLPRKVDSGIVATTKALINLTFVLDAIVAALHAEVVERRSIDRRWIVARAGFSRSQWAHYPGREWPVAP